MNPLQPNSFPPLNLVPASKPSGKIGPLAWPLLLLSLLAMPPILAVLYVKSAHFGVSFFGSIYLVVGAALLLGALIGGALFPAIYFGKVRNIALAATVGLLAGTFGYLLALGLEAHEHRVEVAEQTITISAFPGPTEEMFRAAADRMGPLEITRLYWKIQADKGLSVSRRGTKATVNGGMFVALELIEWLLCAIAAGVVANLLAARRFSEHANRWYRSKTLHSVLPDAVPLLIQAADARDWPRFSEIARASRNPEFKEFKPPVAVHYLGDKPGGLLEIRAVYNPKLPLGTVYEAQISDDELRQLWPEHATLSAR